MHDFTNALKRNWKAGITVGLVSVPLSISLAIASGAAPITGLLTAIWAGLVASIFGGSHHNVVGPAGALSGILAAYALQYGDASLPYIAIAAGIGILVAYVAKWDRYLVFIPGSVMHGFTLGVALIIGLNQLNFALGLNNLPKHEAFIMNIWESLQHIGNAEWSTFAVFAIGLLILFILAKTLPKIPGIIVLAALGIGLGYASETHLIQLPLQTLLGKYGQLTMSLWQMPRSPLPPLDWNVTKTIITVVIVAILETLLSAKIATNMSQTGFHRSREMLGLGLANLASGFSGGLPATGVLARTAINVKNGADSRVSSGINAVAVAMLSTVLFGWFQYLPLAIVAAILVFAAIRMVEIDRFSALYHFDPRECGLAVLVTILTVAIDPLVGILVGAIIVLLIAMRRLSTGQSEITLHRQGQLLTRVPSEEARTHVQVDDVVVYRFAGELNYFNSEAHMESIATIPCGMLVLSLRNLFAIDADGLDALGQIVEKWLGKGGQICITGASSSITPLLHKAEWFATLEQEKRVFTSTTQALSALGFTIGKN